jgi:sugar phosphate isomerase/epimerase
MGTAPADLVTIAADAGYRHVCLFTHVPAVTLTGGGGPSPFPVVTKADRRILLARLRDTGVTVTNVEYFPVAADIPIESYRPALALGADLGARRAVVHIHDSDEARAVDGLGRLADLAQHYGLGIGLEFMGLSPACDSIARACWFLDQVRHPDLGLAIDALHLVRTGGTARDIRAVAPHRIVYAQLCDGAHLLRSADYRAEALDRLLPGHGVFPLEEIIRALPATADLDIEAPSRALTYAGPDASARAREALSLARGLLARADARAP